MFLDPLDRYGRTPLDDANAFNQERCAALLEAAIAKFNKSSETQTNTAGMKSDLP